MLNSVNQGLDRTLNSVDNSINQVSQNALAFQQSVTSQLDKMQQNIGDITGGIADNMAYLAIGGGIIGLAILMNNQK